MARGVWGLQTGGERVSTSLATCLLLQSVCAAGEVQALRADLAAARSGREEAVKQLHAAEGVGGVGAKGRRNMRNGLGMEEDGKLFRVT